MRSMSDRELATVLAALRYWQASVRYNDREAAMPEHFATDCPLDDFGINSLCESISQLQRRRTPPGERSIYDNL